MQVISCGCSWANGAELSPDQSPFGKLVANLLNATYIHEAQDAASIAHMVLQLRSGIAKLDHSVPTVALFLLTNPDRDLIWSKTRPIGTGHRDNSPPYDKYQPIFLNVNDPLHADWFLENYSPELAEYRTNTSLMTMQSLCRFYGIRDYYAFSWDTVPLWEEVDKSRFYREGKESMLDLEFQSTRTNHLIKHPDQAQHQLMADRFLALMGDL